jgi:hypothetical protein
VKPPRPAVAGAFLAALLVAPALGGVESLPSGFHSTGTLVVAATISGAPIDVGGEIALYQRGSRYRLDLLSLGFPGASATVSTVAGTLLAPGGATLIYDGATGAVSAYSSANHVYFEQVPPAAARQSAAAPAPPAADPLGALAEVVRQLHDVQRASIQLTGHSTTNGHATDDFDVMLRRQRPGKALEDYHAQLALADDLDGFPVRILLSSTPPTPQDFGGSLRLDLTAVSRVTPDDATFAIPAGYTRAASLGEVLQGRH